MGVIGRDYFTLDEAFERLGRALYGLGWTKEELSCDRPFEPFSSLSEPKTEAEHRYKSVRIALFEAFWAVDNPGRRTVASRGVNARGELEALSRYIWKDETGENVFSIKDSRVEQRSEGKKQQWRIRVDRTDFVTLLWNIFEVQISSDNSKGGAPSQHDWKAIDAEIVGLYESKDPPVSASQCAKKLVEKDPDSPVESQIRNRIKILKEYGVLE